VAIVCVSSAAVLRTRAAFLLLSAHVVLIHSLAVAICYARYGHVYWMFQSPDPGNYPVTPPPGWGFGLPTIYLLWVIVVMVLYPVCCWFAALKQRRRDAWLSYI